MDANKQPTKQHKHYRKPLRLKNYAYSTGGSYYVTLCTKNKITYFGEIIAAKMMLNDFGKIAEYYWKQIVEYYDHIVLDEFVIMPNHLHGIIIICDDAVTGRCPVTTNSAMGKVRYGILSKVVNSYKGIVTKTINNTNTNLKFTCQRSFYDHIIRNEDSLAKIREYTKNNPLKWYLDEYYQ